MSLENCRWTNRPIYPNYLAQSAYSDNQAEDGYEHRKNQERIKSLDQWQQVFEFKRLKSNDFKPYEDERYYADLAYQKVSNSTLAQQMYDYLMSLPESQRGPIYTNLYLLDFKEVPDGSPTYWADRAAHIQGDKRVYDSIMDAKEEYRADQFLLWATYGFQHESETYFQQTHWGDKAYQIGQGGSDGQANYDYIQRGDLDERSKRFTQLAKRVDDQGKTNFNYMCRDTGSDKKGYYDDEGDYYDPYYSYGKGPLQAIGEWFSAIDWELVGVWAVIIWVYTALSFMGPWLFPPFLICIYTTGGDLDTCSLGIWGNDYTDKTFE